MSDVEITSAAEVLQADDATFAKMFDLPDPTPSPEEEVARDEKGRFTAKGEAEDGEEAEPEVEDEEEQEQEAVAEDDEEEVVAAKEGEEELTSAATLKLARSNNPVAQVEKRVKNSVRLQWQKNIGVLDRSVRFMFDNWGRIKRQDVEDALPVINRCIKDLRKVKEAVK